jgi:hypothetical protein
MKKLPPFVFIAPQSDASGAGFVLHTTKAPYYYAKVLKFKTEDEFGLVNYVNANSPLVHSQIGNYNIILAFGGSLEGNKLRLTAGKQWQEELQTLFDAMGVWYEEEKIKSNLGYYKRFLL